METRHGRNIFVYTQDKSVLLYKRVLFTAAPLLRPGSRLWGEAHAGVCHTNDAVFSLRQQGADLARPPRLRPVLLTSTTFYVTR